VGTAAYRSGVTPVTERCPVCGFDPPTVSPADAVAAARSYPRRWRALLVRPDDDDPEILRRRASPEQPSALELASAATAAFSLVAAALGRIQREDSPGIDVAAPTSTAGNESMEPVLAALAAASEAMAAAMEAIRGEGWERTGRASGGVELRAIDVARHGVHQGIHNLRSADSVLGRVRRGS